MAYVEIPIESPPEGTLLFATVQQATQLAPQNVCGVKLGEDGAGAVQAVEVQSAMIGLWDSAAGVWRAYPISPQLSFPMTLDLNGNPCVADKNYDVYAYQDSGTAVLGFEPWVHEYARFPVPVLWCGVLCYDNTTDVGKSRRFMGTVRGMSSYDYPRVQWSERQRFVANYYHAQETFLVLKNTTSHQCDSEAWRAWNDDAALTKLEWLSHGLAPSDSVLTLPVHCQVQYQPQTAMRVDGSTPDKFRLRLRAHTLPGPIEQYSDPALICAPSIDQQTYHATFQVAEREGYNYAYVEEYGGENGPMLSEVSLFLRLSL